MEFYFYSNCLYYNVCNRRNQFKPQTFYTFWIALCNVVCSHDNVRVVENVFLKNNIFIADCFVIWPMRFVVVDVRIVADPQVGQETARTTSLVFVSLIRARVTLMLQPFAFVLASATWNEIQINNSFLKLIK